MAMRVRFALLAGALLLLGCGTTTIPTPAGMEPLAQATDGAELTARFFPGSEGTFYVLSQTGDGPVIGLVADSKNPGGTFLVGAGSERSWSESLPLEGGHRKVTRARPLQASIGDVRKDGTADIYFVMEIESEPVSGRGRQTRKAAYLYELGKRATLVWYQSLSVVGKDTGECTGGELDYVANVEFGADAEGRLERVSVKFDQVLKTCKGGSNCETAKETCAGGRDSGTVQLSWDEELRTYRKEGATEVVMRIPDVTL
jgi:hypothetical protein